MWRKERVFHLDSLSLLSAFVTVDHKDELPTGRADTSMMKSVVLGGGGQRLKVRGSPAGNQDCSGLQWGGIHWLEQEEGETGEAH